MIAFLFGALLEAIEGLGTPAAITGSLMAGLGFEPMYAASLALLANTAPVAFGDFGILILTAGQVSGLDPVAVSQMVGRQTPFLAVIIPAFLVTVMAGFRRMLEVWPAVMVAGLTFALTQFLVSNFIGPELADLLASLVAVVAIIALLAVWRPREERLEPEAEEREPFERQLFWHDLHPRSGVRRDGRPVHVLRPVHRVARGGAHRDRARPQERAFH